MSTPRVSVTGKPLPSPRIVSALVHRDLGFHDHAVTTFLPAWGQMIDHDMARGADTIGNLLQQLSKRNFTILCTFFQIPRPGPSPSVVRSIPSSATLPASPLRSPRMILSTLFSASLALTLSALLLVPRNLANLVNYLIELYELYHCN